MRRSAVISPCTQYRYRLDRAWDDAGHTIRWIMLNPSTADAEKDDPTVRKCIGFSKRWGFGALSILNLFALRSTSPAALLHHPTPVGPDNDKWLRECVFGANHFVFAWGANAPEDRAREVMDIFVKAGVGRPMCLGTNKNGTPNHPLMIPYSRTLTVFP
jgi:hypothetical protein